MKLLKKSGVLFLLSLLAACSGQMDEKAVKDYLSKSPAVILYDPVSSDKKLTGCDEDYLGKKDGLFKTSPPDYYYKGYNYKVDRLEDFKAEKDQVSCIAYLYPDTLTKAGKIIYDAKPQNPYKAQLKDGVDCDVVFKKVDGKWVLVCFKSKRYVRGYWLEKYQESSGYLDLLQWDRD